MPRKRGRKSRSTWGSNDDAGAGRRRLRYWADLHDGRGYTRHSKTILGTKKDGDEELARIRVAHSQDRPVPTLGQAYEMWWHADAVDRLERSELARSTLKMYESMWRSYVEPRWSDVPVGDIRPLDVQEWLMGMPVSSAPKALMIMKQVLDKCELYDIVDGNVASRSYRMPKRVERTHDKDVYTLSELTAALDAVRGTVAYIPAVLCGLASCRPGEALGPMRAEVHEASHGGMTLAVVDLVRQVDRDGHVVEGLKTTHSERPVVVPEPWSLDVLSQPGPWLVGSGERPVSQGVVKRAWFSSLGDAGVEAIPFRNLRNTWRTFMRWDLKLPEDLLEAMMGHVGRNVGEAHYDRPREEVFAREVADAWVRYRAS